MAGDLLPENGKIVTDAGEYFSASAIAALNLRGMPKSRAGVYKRAEREGWPFVFQRGRGAKDGVKYFLMPPGSMPDVAYVSTPVTPLNTGSGAAYRLSANEHAKTDEFKIGIDEYVSDAADAGYDKAVVKLRVNMGLLQERIGNGFDQLRLAAVFDDSMEPTLSHGDQVLIDASCNRIVKNAIYAIQQDGRLRFKRIQLKLDGSIVVRGDNLADHNPEIYTAEQARRFKVVGMVIPFKFGRFKL